MSDMFNRMLRLVELGRPAGARRGRARLPHNLSRSRMIQRPARGRVSYFLRRDEISGWPVGILADHARLIGDPGPRTGDSPRKAEGGARWLSSSITLFPTTMTPSSRRLASA